MIYTTAFISGIRKTKHTYTLAELKGLIKNGSIIIAPWNRKQVKIRPGTSADLFLSIKLKRGMGSLLAYVNGRHSDTYTPTPENPLLVTDGGHRLRWLNEIFESIPSIDDNTYATLPSDVRAAVDAYEVSIDVTTHVDGADLEDYAKEEYVQVNRTTCTLSNGEMLIATTNETQEELVAALDTAFSNRDLKVASREKNAEVKVAIIAGLTKGSDKMTTKREDVMDLEISEEEKARALKGIACIKEIEDRLFRAFQNNNNALSIIANRPINLQFDGPTIAAIAECSTDEERARVVETNVKAYTTMLSAAQLVPEPIDVPVPVGASKTEIKTHNAAMKAKRSQHKKDVAENLKRAKEQWAVYMKRIGDAGPGNQARFYNKKRYMHGWSQLKTIVAVPA
jgi:hypothetical protein